MTGKEEIMHGNGADVVSGSSLYKIKSKNKKEGNPIWIF
jgi:hypothetical protein